MPHARGSVLLPGIIQRLPVSSTGTRPDIPAILANIYTRAASKGPNEPIDTIPIACVPVTSPFLGSDGHLLIDNGDETENTHGRHAKAGPITKTDLYKYGVAAKILGVEGSGTGEFYLRIEGTSRVSIEKIVQERPYFEAKVRYFQDEGMPSPVRLARFISVDICCPSFRR
jgi:ATP-dependent Lon protease